MPSWGLAPADTLEAKYDFTSQKLILIAEGHVGNYSSGISFDRVQIPNGLLFQLSDWHVIGSPRVAYKHSQSFDIKLPNRNFPSNRVTIETQSGFHPLQISGLPTVADSAEEKGAQYTPPKSNLAMTESRLIKRTPIMEDLIVVHKELFHVTTTTFVRGHPSALLDISIKFDPNFFELQTTTAQYLPTTKSTILTYTFSSIQTGTSQILVRRLIQTLIPQLETTIYNTDIDLPSHPTFIPSSKLAKLLHSPEEQRPLSFLERVLMGYEVVRRHYPKAQLLEVDASAVKSGMPVETPMGFVVLRLTLSPCDASDRTVTISSTGWNDWEDPVAHDFVTWDLMPIPIPPEVEKAAKKERVDIGLSSLECLGGEKEEVDEDVCKGCGGTGETGGHSPSCSDDDNEEKLSNRANKTAASGKIRPPPSFATTNRTPRSKRERTKTTSHNFTISTAKNNQKPQPKEYQFLDIQTAFKILTTATPPQTQTQTSPTPKSTTTNHPKIISCNLRHPMYPGFNEPYYVFTLQEPLAGMGSLYVGIGAVDGEIRVFGGGQSGAVRRLSDAGEGTLDVGGTRRVGGEWERGVGVGAC